MWEKNHQELSNKLSQIVIPAPFQKIYQNKFYKFVIDFKKINVKAPQIEDIHKALYLMTEGVCLLRVWIYKNDIVVLAKVLEFLEDFVDYFQKINEKI